MKHISKKILALLLALCALVCTACSTAGTTAFSYKSQKASQEVFRYLCSLEKTSYLCDLYGISMDSSQASSLEDNPAIWTGMKDGDGVALGETLKKEVEMRLEIYLYLAQYAIDQGYKLTSDQLASVRSDLDNFVKQFESKKAFNNKMKEYGVNYSLLYDYYVLQGQASVGDMLLFGEGGKLEVTAAQAKSYFESKYHTINFVYINNASKVYPNGKTVYLTEEEKAAKTALAKEAFEKAKAGEDFTTLIETYSDSKTEESVKSGVTYTSGSLGKKELEAKGAEMKIGDIAYLETEGGIYVIKKLPLNKDYYEAEKDSILDELTTRSKEKLVNDRIADFEIDREFLDSVDISTLAHVQ